MEILELPRVRELLERIGGELAPEVIKVFSERTDITDEELSQLLNVKVTVVRSVLNKLNYWGITVYDSKRDEHTGWYTYLWRLNPEKLKELVMEEVKEELDKLEQTRKLLKEYFVFECPKCGERMPMEVAMEHDFVCPHCGAPLRPVDRDKELKELEKKIYELNSFLSKIK